MYKDLNINIVCPGKDSTLGVDSVCTVPASLVTYASIQAMKPDLIINAGTAGGFKKEDELLSLWWKKYAECSVGPRPQVETKNKSVKLSTDSSSEPSMSSSLYEFEEERVGVPVKGGLYEVDLVRRHCFPIYWNGDNWHVRRGHWFARKGGLEWVPILETVGEQLEIAYHNKYHQ